MMEHDCKGDECWYFRVASVSVASSAMPSRRPEAVSTLKAEQKLVKNRSAYKAMVEQGIQPASLGRAAELQDRASTKSEIETGRILPKKLAGKVEEAKKELAKK